MVKDLLLVIDMQNVYAPGGKWCCPGSEAAAENIKRIIRQTPELDVNADTCANEMLPQFEEELRKYPLCTKSTYSSLSIPQVRQAAARADRVVITGVVAECCVLSTVLALIDEGIPVVYLTDAVAGVSEETQAAAELILSGLEPVHVQRMNTAAYLEKNT